MGLDSDQARHHTLAEVTDNEEIPATTEEAESRLSGVRYMCILLLLYLRLKVYKCGVMFLE